MIFGLFTVVKCCCAPAKAAASPWGAVLMAVLLLVGGSWLYRATEGALIGIQQTAAEANRIAAWGFVVALVIGALTAAAWFLIGRRREVKMRPLVEQHQQQMRVALAAQRRPAIAPSTPRSIERVAATRLDRAGTPVHRHD